MEEYPRHSMRIKESETLPPYSDRAILPSNILSEIIERQGNELPHPMIFKITDEHNNVAAYIGVKEFTSPEDDLIMLPKSVYRRLGESEGVSISLVESIPKATFMKVKPLHFYSQISNWKYFLEDKLNKYYTVLSYGENVILEDNNLRYELNIEETNNETVCIIDTDVVLDVVPLNDDKAMEQLEFSKMTQGLENIEELEGEIYINELKPFSDPKFAPRIFKIDVSKHSHKFFIQLEDRKFHDDESVFNVDVVVGLDKLVSLENFHWTSLDKDFDIQKNRQTSSKAQNKFIEIDPTSHLIKERIQVDDEGETDHFIYVVPFTWETTADVCISIVSEIDTGSPDIFLDPNKSSKCSNCKQSVPKDKISLHESFCLRNNVRCACGLIFLKEIPSYHWHCEEVSEHYGNSSFLKSKHSKLYHQNFRCTQCDYTGTYDNFVDLVVEHKAQTCPAKLHECRFCHLIVPQEESTYQDRFENLTHHENECGNRTTECYKCGKVFKLKAFSKHLQLHELQKMELNEHHKIMFQKCSNQNCVNPPTDNELSLCDFCYGPFYVSQQDPTHIKLQARIERKYVIQLTKGCNNPWCANPNCVTGNPSSPWKRRPLREVLIFISQDLLCHVSSPPLPINKDRQPSPNAFWFCVNQSVQNKKVILDLIVSEGSYEPELVYKAVSHHSDEQSIRDWLKNNAVPRSIVT